ncbi:aminoglycoside phosphotransferase family protein [Alkalibacterium sp. AK22]|uniref:phosphotransferase family protein n=1 Tax=Alkalibacterium sp. AK22 TaxID=1229520 RepID=UPI00044B3786|nr:phosphotransferase family protein [Alkalibacterium sp. AK22]EXJ22911.1 aminoglycoside phosphotransferase family protein [Alkalibacterium sp. AK22]
MELERETGWQLHPIGGDTGQAYMGTKNEERLFLKRNSSPFLAALSLEGISPRLVWTKRIGNGDVLTAQEWCNGRTLNREEMTSLSVIQIIKKVHRSSSLKRMLNRLGGRTLLPSDLYYDSVYKLDPDLMTHPLIKQAITFLGRNMPESPSDDEQAVCHGDISHKNLLLSSEEELYLVDWDSAVLADPVVDMSQLLVRYIEFDSWSEWTKEIGVHSDGTAKLKLYWYAVVNLVLDTRANHIKQDYIRMNKNLIKLNQILSDMSYTKNTKGEQVL